MTRFPAIEWIPGDTCRLGSGSVSLPQGLTPLAEPATVPQMSRHPTRPRDLNQRAFHIVQETTGEPQSRPDPNEGKNAAAVALGRKGGKVRAQNVSKDRRSEIARNAANKRWKGTL